MAEAADLHVDFEAGIAWGETAQVIAGSTIALYPPGGGGRHSEYRDRRLGASQPMKLPLMAMAVEDEAAPLMRQDLIQLCRIGQTLSGMDAFWMGWMMDQQYSAAGGTGVLFEQFGQALKLLFANCADGQEGGARRSRIYSDQNRRASLPQRREKPGTCFPIAGQIGFPQAERILPGSGDVAIVVTRNYGDFIGRSKPRQPIGRLMVFAGQSQLGQIASNGNVVRLLVC